MLIEMATDKPNLETAQQVNRPTNQLVNFVLHLADNALILGHRNSEWCGHGPVLEQDIALTNIALDLIGQSRYLYQYAAKLMNENPGSHEFRFEQEIITEDVLAYFRDARQFRNSLLVELPNGDWAQTLLRQFLFSAYQFPLYTAMQNSLDKELAAIAGKAVKEVNYHLRWSGEWVVRLGDGTEESHGRMMRALDELWMYTGELLEASKEEKMLLDKGISVDLESVKRFWNEKIEQVFSDANLPLAHIREQKPAFFQTGGKQGMHTEYLGYVLAEMQFVQRAYPGCEW